MKVYSVLMTLEVNSTYVFDEGSMMAKCLVIIKEHFNVVKTMHHIFVQGAFTYVMILSESHVVMQTYPELNRIFITMEFHEEDECKKQIDDKMLVSQLVKAIGGELVQFEKMGR